MKTALRILRLGVLLAATGAALVLNSQESKNLGQHPFFKAFVGEWKVEGELKGENGNVLKVTETWTGKVDEQGGLYIEGMRTVDGDTKPFKWTITHNPSTDGFEAVVSGTEPAETVRFEGSYSEVTQTLDLKAITGTGGSAITLQDSFADEGKDTLHSKVTFTGEQGNVTLEGTLVHKRVKTP